MVSSGATYAACLRSAGVSRAEGHNVAFPRPQRLPVAELRVPEDFLGLWRRQDLRPGFGDGDSVLDMSGEAPVCCT